MIKPESTRPRAVLCLSGGMDSSVCAALVAQNYEVFALHFSYGQRTEARELRSAQEVARIVGAKEFLHLKIDLFRRIGGSALTDTSIAVPPAGDEAAIGNEVPVTYVPFRNAHFLSAAVSWAEVLGAEKVFIGAVEQDSSGYPDCRPAYYEAFNQLIKMGTKEGKIQVVTPLIQMRKSEIVRLGVEVGHAIPVKPRPAAFARAAFCDCGHFVKLARPIPYRMRSRDRCILHQILRKQQQQRTLTPASMGQEKTTA